VDNPILFVVDDDPEVLRAITRDLRYQYGEKFRIMRSDSGVKALNVLEKLALRNDSVALLLVDQRMPDLTGIELLEKSMRFFPKSKRVLLTAYADTDAAIQAINQANLDYYLLKPWVPAEEKLYPVIDDLLENWWESFQPAFRGIVIISFRWSPELHRIKDFLARNFLPYQCLDVEVEEARQKLAIGQITLEELPVVIFPDGTTLRQPSNLQIAEKVGLKTHAEMPFYDLAIIGAGPAGLAAAVYGASEGLRTILIEKEAPGGQAGTSSRIENYLGFPVGLSGADLARRAVTQAKRFGVEFLTSQEVVDIQLRDPYRVLVLKDGTRISCYAMVLATGVAYRKLPVPGAEELCGKGIYYGAAMTEALSCADQEVYVVGGANSAGQAALHLSQFARRVTILVRGDSLAKSMSQYLIDQIKLSNTIRVLTQSALLEVNGQSHCERVRIENTQTGQICSVPADAVFVFIGSAPRTDWVANLLARDEAGFLLTGPNLPKQKTGQPQGWCLAREPYLLESNIPGIFAAGDVRASSVKRVASAVGEGAIAVQFIHQYLKQV
jgi:thioredoxin reductase (NADPH)